jgi:hypothetical protein
MNLEGYGTGGNPALGNLRRHLLKIQELILKLRTSGFVDTKGKKL